MNQRRKFFGLLAVSLTAIACGNSSSLISQPELSNDSLWSRLQQPKDTIYVILFRHAIAPGTGDPANFTLNDCSTQRNLSQEGREQAIRMGEALKRRQIPIKRVLSSQWCRCLDTATLMDVGKVEPFPPLNSFFSDRTQADKKTSQLRQFLLEETHEKGVIVMVSHQVNITAISDIFPRSGEGVVLRIDQDENDIKILGRLFP
jgi:phosphohistidine phosphatase SixA